MFNCLEVSSQQAAVPDHLKSDVLRGMREAKLMLRQVFGTKNIHTFGVAGASWNGPDCLLSAILPTDKVIIFVNESIDKKNSLNLRMGNPVPDNAIVINTPHNARITRELVETTLATYQPKWAMMVHGEAESGRTNDIEGFSNACLKHDTMGLIDTVSPMGIADFSIDDYPGVVAWASSSQSHLPLTYTPVSLTDQYIETIKQTGVSSYEQHPIHQAGHWGIIDGSDREVSTYHYSHSQDTVSAFHEALRILLKYGGQVLEEHFAQPIAA